MNATPLQLGSAEAPGRPSGDRNYFAGLALVVLVILAYTRVFHAGFIWDDDDYIVKNPLLTAPDGLWRIWFSLDSPSQYFPLVYTTFRFEHALWGLNPVGYHCVNIALHIANALLVWVLLGRLGVPGAWLAAMIFALHPVQVESVAWITERKNVLMAFFFLLALLCWHRFVDQTKQRSIFYALALVAYAIALTAKTTACTLPTALLLILWLQRRPITRMRLLQVLPFLVLGFAMGSLTVWWERYHIGTRGEMFGLGLLDRLLVASRGVWFYLSKLIWPSDLAFIYPQWTIDPSDSLAYAWPIGILAAFAAICILRRWLGRGPEVAAVFFVATLSPLLGFIMLYTFRYTYVADHYQYIASIGPIAVISAGVVTLGQRLKYGRQFVSVTAALILSVLGVLTWRQSAMYSNLETLWRTTIARNPGCWMAYNNLGIALVEKGHLDEAIAQYRKSLQLQSTYPPAHYNLATALLDTGKIDEAIAECNEALRLKPNEPDALVVMGNALMAKGHVDEAIREYREASRLRPHNSNAHFNMGNALLKKSAVESATAEFEEALRFDPGFVEAHMALGDVFAGKDDWRRAIAHYEQALKLSHGSIGVYNNLGWILASCPDLSLRNGGRAVALAEKANQLSNGANSVILHTLAAAYAERGEFGRAISTAEQALQLATREGNSALAEDLRRELEAYRRGSSYPSS